MILYGRKREKEELDRLLDGARAGAGGALVLWGDPGIGKTALLEYATGLAADLTVLSCRGTRMESGLAFAALHELLWPVADRFDTLPEPQAAALRGALGHGGESPNDRFLTGVATLTLLSELAAERPLLITVDDTDLLDAPTAECLAFVARRLRGEPVALLVADRRDPSAGGPWELLPGLEIAPLSDGDAAELLRREVVREDEEAVQRTVRMAAGNPLALWELPTVQEDRGGFPERGAVGPRLRRAFGTRISQLTAAAQTLLLVAAAEERGDQHAVQAAAASLGVGSEAWEEVSRSGLLAVAGGRVRFRTPLVAAVVYEAPFAERQAVHRALADLMRGEDDEGLRAWHLAAAADRPDEEVAALLEHSARTSVERGGHASAARALRRAAELSPASADAARRYARGARAAYQAGRAEAARGLLDHADRLATEEEVAAADGGLRGMVEFAHGSQELAHRLLLRDSHTVPDRADAVRLASLAVRAGWSAGSARLQTEALTRLDELDGERVPELGLLTLVRRWWGGEPGTPLEPLDKGSLARIDEVPGMQLPPAPLVVAWGAEGQFAEAYRRKVAALRRTDEISSLVFTLPQTVTFDIVGGRWQEAEANAAETLRLAEEAGAEHAASQCRNSLAWLAALRGDEETVTRLTARTLETSVPRGVRALTAAAYWYRGLAALLAGRPEDALDQLTRLTETGHQAAHPTFALLASETVVEAAVRAGRPELAAAPVRALREWAARCGAVWAEATALRCSALLGGEDAEESFRRSLRLQGPSERPFQHACTRLLYGEWLRRARRRTDARVQLAEAAEVFRRFDTRPMLDRALDEMALTGQQVHQPDAHRGRAEPTLTPQELRVARLAADGLTNREIAAQLLISPRTVGHHLANIFPKLGIVSRGELARVDFANGFRLMTDPMP